MATVPDNRLETLLITASLTLWDSDKASTSAKVLKTISSPQMSVAQVARELVEEVCPAEWLMRICNRSAKATRKDTFRILYGNGFCTNARCVYERENESSDGGRVESSEVSNFDVSVSLTMSSAFPPLLLSGATRDSSPVSELEHDTYDRLENATVLNPSDAMQDHIRNIAFHWSVPHVHIRTDGPLWLHTDPISMPHDGGAESNGSYLADHIKKKRSIQLLVDSRGNLIGLTEQPLPSERRHNLESATAKDMLLPRTEPLGSSCAHTKPANMFPLTNTLTTVHDGVNEVAVTGELKHSVSSNNDLRTTHNSHVESKEAENPSNPLVNVKENGSAAAAATVFSKKNELSVSKLKNAATSGGTRSEPEKNGGQEIGTPLVEKRKRHRKANSRLDSQLDVTHSNGGRKEEGAELKPDFLKAAGKDLVVVDQSKLDKPMRERLIAKGAVFSPTVKKSVNLEKEIVKDASSITSVNLKGATVVAKDSSDLAVTPTAVNQVDGQNEKVASAADTQKSDSATPRATTKRKATTTPGSSAQTKAVSKSKRRKTEDAKVDAANETTLKSEPKVNTKVENATKKQERCKEPAARKSSLLPSGPQVGPAKTTLFTKKLLAETTSTNPRSEEEAETDGDSVSVVDENAFSQAELELLEEAYNAVFDSDAKEKALNDVKRQKTKRNKPLSDGMTQLSSSSKRTDSLPRPEGSMEQESQTKRRVWITPGMTEEEKATARRAKSKFHKNKEQSRTTSSRADTLLSSSKISQPCYNTARGPLY